MESIPDFLNQLELAQNEQDLAFSNFKSELVRKIAHLLDNNPDQLFQFFYKFDLNEALVKNAIFGTQEISSAELLADLVIQRALQKIETRKKYK